MKEEIKKTLISIVEELRKEESMTNSRMLAIQNATRKSIGLEPKKVCSTNKQKLVELVRSVFGENLTEKVTYSISYGEGRKPTEFSITDPEKALSDIEVYFSKKEEKVRKASTDQKKVVVSKLLSILEKISETEDNIIGKDLLSELIDAKTPVSGTLRNWSSMLEKEGINLLIKSAGRGIYKVENLEETKEKLEDLYGKLTEEGERVKRKKTTTPIIIKKEFKELTEEDEKIVYLLAEKCNHHEVPYSQIWTSLRKQGISAGIVFTEVIQRAGLKKWFVQTKKRGISGIENYLEFVGNLNAVAQLMGQEVEKTILVRSSLEHEDIKTIMKNSTVTLKLPMPNANIYSIRYSKENLSVLDLLKLKLSFRGYDGFIEESDEEFVDSIIKKVENLVITTTP